MAREKEQSFTAGIFHGSQEEYEKQVIDIGRGVTVDLNDLDGHPVMIERDGWMPLTDAKELRALIDKAISMVEERQQKGKTNGENSKD